ncbi:peptidoglycan-binding protein [Rhizobium sp. 18065]|uniref:peptidoglycan-binding protein n=1 Tax=Rhizobium sp. 18065 TaxID=2681411 RepID=UPI00135C8520|nr:peptidoglycan-binding protein [Rhizobium sp. 18065]
MNGSRSPSQRPGGTSSLDALSRTIEGLEARIDGLIGQSGRNRPTEEPMARAPEPSSRPQREFRDPLAEIRERQRLLEESRNRTPERSTYRSETAVPAAPAQPALRDPAPSYREPLPPLREPLPTLREQAADRFATRSDRRAEIGSRDITEALLGLRQELKQDIAESMAREIAGLRHEMRSIRTLAEESRPNEDMRADFAKLADSIHQLDAAKAPGADGLQAEFNELRSLMDGLAREDSVARMERRWSDVEVRLGELDTSAMREEIIRLADRLDDIKAHLGTMGDTRAIRALEEKLITVAAALEHIGAHIDPNERMVMEQFAGIDMRLDEITRAIAAGSRTATANTDTATLHRLEDRLAGLARQIEGLNEHRDPQTDASEELAQRLELLTLRIEQLSTSQSTAPLEDRLDQLSYMLERNQKPVPAPELTGYLADISRKIDALDTGSVNDRLADRLEVLARRIEELDLPVAATAQIDDSAFRDLEDRLNAVVYRLEETSASTPATDSASLRGLEEQIAHLSMLISQPSSDPEVAGRISALEDYVATSDEYIIEAARQAAETVMANFAHRGPSSAASTADLSALTALSDHLRQLEDFSRNSEERTHRTFEALHGTLVQIAGRLDELQDSAQRPEPALFAQAPIAQHQDRRPEPARAEPVRPEPVRPPAMPAMTTASEAVIAEAHPIDAELQAAADAFAETMTALPVIQAARNEKKPAKPSLLAGLGKKLLPSKKEPKPTEARQLIDPVPSIDPVDMVSVDEDNELLEPGSGAPDVRKILERVRASQQAPRNDASGKDGNDRTDYIAAARRAAQAAAMEMDRAQKTPPASRTAAGAKAKATAMGTGTDKGAEKGAEKASLFGRYRRPILMAVGAILLAAMAMPLINTLTRDDSDSQSPAPIEAPATDENSQIERAPASIDTAASEAPVTVDASAAPTEAAMAVPPPEAAASLDTASDEPAAPATDAIGADVPTTNPVVGETQAAAEPAAALIAPTETAPPQTLDSSPAPAAETSTLAPPPADAKAAAIVVPATITPPSLSIAAKDGDPVALFEIGARYTDGRGVSSDFAEAAKWYQLSADRGFVPAQYRLANLYEKGTGVPRDIATAKRYYEMAANAGNASAMHNLAVLFASGADGAQDYAKAVEWFEKAAEFGISDSQFNLAILYARGNGVKQDLTASYKWFAVAAKEGDKDAAQKRDEVANAMKPDQLERARAEVDLWKAKPVDADANTVNTPDEWAGKGLKTASVDMKKAIFNIQAILNKNGFDAGKPDGVMGGKTVTAIKAFQTSIGEQPTGQVSDKLVNALLARNK